MLKQVSVNTTDIPLNELCGIYPKLPCGHENAESNINIANYTYKHILKQYPNIKPIQTNYISRKDFGVDKHEMCSHTHWV